MPLALLTESKATVKTEHCAMTDMAKSTKPPSSVGEEECDGLCPDIRARGDLGGHQFRWIFVTIMTNHQIDGKTRADAHDEGKLSQNRN